MTAAKDQGPTSSDVERMRELLPCPFCGAPAFAHENDWCEPPEWGVYCSDTKCRAATSKAEAIAAWNRRAAITNNPDAVERVARALCTFNCEQACSGCPDWTHYMPAANAALLSLSGERDSPALRTGLCNSSFANPEAPPTRPAMEPPCPECGQPYVPTKQRDRFVRRPSTSNADEWQLWLQDGLTYEPASGCAFLAVQIVEAIEEHQRALAREVYGLAEDAAERFSDLASEDTPEGHYSRGAIAEAKSIARAINAIMPYSCDPSSLKDGT
jgi:hypothetical protein